MFEWSQGKFHWELFGLQLQPLVLMENPPAARLLDDLVCEVTAQATYDLHKFPFQGMYLSRLKASHKGLLDRIGRRKEEASQSFASHCCNSETPQLHCHTHLMHHGRYCHTNRVLLTLLTPCSFSECLFVFESFPSGHLALLHVPRLLCSWVVVTIASVDAETVENPRRFGVAVHCVHICPQMAP